jgi:hypothetical protein
MAALLALEQSSRLHLKRLKNSFESSSTLLARRPLRRTELGQYRPDGWRKIAISNNVGGVKGFSSTLQHALEEERHFALVGCFALSNLGSLLIVGVRNSVRPIHLFDPNCDHDYYFELPCEGERDTQSLRR